MRVAFLGLGKMGCALVPHLLNAGHIVTVWNRNTTIAEKFAAQGAEVARSAADAVTKCEVVFTLLLNDAVLEGVLFDGGVLDAMLTSQTGCVNFRPTVSLPSAIWRARWAAS